jgi:hypothetical protein
MKYLLAVLSLAFMQMARGQNTGGKEETVIFSSEKAINANTTELVGEGRMEFKVTHNFNDIGGSFGGLRNFFGLDYTTDVRIGFGIGLTKKLDVIVARVKAAGNISRIFELAVKYRFLQQTHDNSIPLSLALYANNCISTIGASDSPLDENYFPKFSNRMSQLLQLIAAKKIGKVSLQLNPTYLMQGYVVPQDEKNLFSLGGAIRFPVSHRLNIIIDYFHTFRNQSSRDFFAQTQSIHFHDPLSIGFEILTGGHVFHLNFTNAREILENRFIPKTFSSWGNGEFRWGFNISRKFNLWKEKNKKKS